MNSDAPGQRLAMAYQTIEDLKAELSKHQWRTIESAPKSEEDWILVWSGGSTTIAAFVDGVWLDAHGEISNQEDITHWQPLPEGPK